MGSIQRPNATTPKCDTCKVVLLGEAAVGKSSIVLRYAKGLFTENAEATIGASFTTQQMIVDEERTRKLEIWDTAGQERFKCIVPMYTRNAQGAIIVFDITKKDSFDRAKQCVSDLRHQAPSDAFVVLVGNKLDLEDQRIIPKNEAQNFAEERNLQYFESSAKTGENVHEIFSEIAKMAPDNEQTKQEKAVDLEDEKSFKKRGFLCCK